MDKKIAIVTLWANPNYGSTLQAYALQKVIRKLGYESEFINFCPEKRSPSYRLSRLLNDVIILSCRPKVHLQRRRIRKFISSHFFVSPPYYTITRIRTFVIRSTKDTQLQFAEAIRYGAMWEGILILFITLLL